MELAVNKKVEPTNRNAPNKPVEPSSTLKLADSRTNVQ